MITANRTYVLERFFALVNDPQDKDEGMYDILVVVTQIEERLARDPDSTGCDLIPIAELFAGDCVCLDFSSGAPTIVVWDHEQSDMFSPKTYHVANSFSEFLGMLKQ